MFRDTKYFILFLVLILLLVAGYRYKKYIIDKDFIINVSTACNISTERCFIADCSPNDDSECDVTPYKKVEILAAVASACLGEHTCENFSCESSENCNITYCSEENLDVGEKCYDNNASETQIYIN
jgi:hypothetical protein